MSLGQGEGVPSQVSVILPTLVKSMRRQNLTDDQITGMLGFARDFIVGILTDPNAEVIPLHVAPENQGVETVAEGAL